MNTQAAVVAAERRGRLDPTLRFLREVLGVEDATDLIEATPQLASTPLAVLAARHAYLSRVGAPHGAQLATPGLRRRSSATSAPRPRPTTASPRPAAAMKATWRRSWPRSGAAAGARPRRTATRF